MPTEAVFRQNDGKKQITGNAKALGVGIVQRIEIVGHLLGEVTALLPGKTDIAVELSIILVDKHSLDE